MGEKRKTLKNKARETIHRQLVDGELGFDLSMVSDSGSFSLFVLEHP